MLLFIEVLTTLEKNEYYFNTSHVTVYHNIHNNKQSIFFYFNTSHVTVYLPRTALSCFPFRISIHLMLLFIRMVGDGCVADTEISIHLMLLFIFRTLAALCCILHFNTSHVTVYQSSLY